jgi:hypothetical protein
MHFFTEKLYFTYIYCPFYLNKTAKNYKYYKENNFENSKNPVFFN